MRILGIDPGLARVGYGVIDIQDGCQRMLDCGIIQTDSGRSDGDRMVEIAGDLRQLIRIWRPELAAVEKFFFYRSCLLYTSPSPRDYAASRMPSSA